MPTVVLSSVGVTSTLILDYIGAKTTTFGVTVSSTTLTADFTIQGTLDSSAASGSAPTWFLISTTHYSSTISDTGTLLIGITTPIAGLRLSSTALSSGSITLKALQNAGG